MSVDHRALRAVCRGFRDLPADHAPVSRIEIERAYTLGTAAAEELAAVGYLRKSKQGSRVVYTRGAEERAARTDLPDGWAWHLAVYWPGGERFERHEIMVDGWSSSGSPLVLTHLKLDGVDVVAIEIAPLDPKGHTYGNTSREEFRQRYEEGVAWMRKQAADRSIQIRDLETGGIVFFAALTDRDAALRVSKLANDRSYRRK